MEARLQRRVQRYGWDLAAAAYAPLWRAQLAPAHERMLALARLQRGERVLDVACGSGLVSLDAAVAVGAGGAVVAVDLAQRMVDLARARAAAAGLAHARFERMDAEALALPPASFEAVLCGLGLMYVPDPAQALREMRRVACDGGRIVLAVWGRPARCGWSAVFGIVDEEVRSEVCPHFFALGAMGALAALCETVGLEVRAEERIGVDLEYEGAADACAAAFEGGPVALAWSRFDAATRARVCARYEQAIATWRAGRGYRVPGEFVVVRAVASA